MIRLLVHLFLCCIITNAIHFNGGTIRWEAIDPYSNASIVSIRIIQTYSWTYPTIKCDINVPITTSGRSNTNANLTCVTDCSTDGGYRTKPVNILTDCQTVNSALGLMTSQRSVNVSLTAGAHFYLAYVGSAWTALNDPPKSGLEWSIVCSVDLRMRPDGFINTPPSASVVSPQYAIVNRTTQITIPVWDANPTDDVRCRWSVYTAGSRRRRRSADQESINRNYVRQIYKGPSEHKTTVHIRKKRGDACKDCTSTCKKDCLCTCSGCTGTTCTSPKCTEKTGCPAGTTTIETPGTVKPTSSYPTRQAIDECGGICYPGSVPNGTTLTGCTISFKGLVSGTWYAVAIQVEDFIDSTSTTAMSSVPVQLLIYVMDQPICGLAPVIIPLTRCFDAQVNVSISFNISARTLCDPTVSDINNIMVTTAIAGANPSNLTTSLTNASVSYVTFTWTPLASQLGTQQLCVVAYTDETIASSQYCVTFNVITTPATCITTTRTTSTTSTASTTSTSRTTSSTSSTTSTESTTSTSQTTTTSSTSTSSSSTSTSTTSTESTTSTSQTTTTSSTSSSSSSTSTSTTSTESTTSTSETTTTSSTSSSSSSTSTSTTSTESTTSTSQTTTTSSTTSSSTSSSTSTSSTSTTTTTQTTTSTTSTTSTTATTTTRTTTKKPATPIDWLLILGLSLLALLLAVCCSCFCLYCLRWKPAKRDRRQRKNSASKSKLDNFIPIGKTDTTQKNRISNKFFQKNKLHKNDSNYRASNFDDTSSNTRFADLRTDLYDSAYSKSASNTTNSEGNQNLSKSSTKQPKRVSIKRVSNIEKPVEPGNAWMKPPTYEERDASVPHKRHSTVTVQRIKSLGKLNKTNSIPQTNYSRLSSTLASSTNSVRVAETLQEESSIEMKPITNQFQDSLSAGYQEDE